MFYVGFMRRHRISNGAFTRGAPRHPATDPLLGGRSMLDLILLALGVGVFALMAAYATGCERV